METIQNVKVQNMTSPRGKTVPNQFIITTEKGEYFQSYKSVIAFKPSRSHCIANGIDYPIRLDSKYWDYSTTTGKYRNQFLGETKDKTQAKIDSGEYILADLNAN